METAPPLESSRFTDERERLIEAFLSDPERAASTFYTISRGRVFSPYLPSDQTPLCCAPGGNNPGYRCGVDYPLITRGKHGKIYGVPGGKYVLKARRIGRPFVRYIREGGRAFSGALPFRGKCGFPGEFARLAIASDDFTNEVIVSYFLGELLDMPGARDAGLDNVATSYAATICTGREGPLGGSNYEGVIMVERGDASLDDVSNPVFSPYQEVGFTYHGRIPLFSEYFIINVVGQVLLVLLYLHNWSFVHGDLKIGNLVFFSRPYGYYPADFTVKLIDFEKSSITLDLGRQRHRVFNYSSLASGYLALNPFRPEVEEGYFTLDHLLVSQIYADSRHNPVPYYQSFDLYTLIISMSLSPAYFFSFSRYPGLITKIWEVLFDEEHFTIVYERVYRAQGILDPNSMDDILTVLKDVPLKCDLPDLLYRSIFAK